VGGPADRMPPYLLPPLQVYPSVVCDVSLLLGKRQFLLVRSQLSDLYADPGAVHGAGISECTGRHLRERIES